MRFPSLIHHWEFWNSIRFLLGRKVLYYCTLNLEYISLFKKLAHALARAPETRVDGRTSATVTQSSVGRQGARTTIGVREIISSFATKQKMKTTNLRTLNLIEILT